MERNLNNFVMFLALPCVVVATLMSGVEAGPLKMKAEEQHDREFSRFLTLNMLFYRTWLLQNSKDPSLPVPAKVDLDVENEFVDIDCALSNVYVSGHSGVSYLQTISTTSFNKSSFTVEYETPGSATLEGDYNATGFINGFRVNPPVSEYIPVNGQGKWSMKFTRYLEEVTVSGFEITPAFYVNMSTPETRVSSYLTPAALNIFEFEGLWDDEQVAPYAKYVRDALLEAITWQYLLEEDLLKPTSAAIYEYLTEVVEKTPLSDIISGPLPPQMKNIRK